MKKSFPCWKVQYYDAVTLCWCTIPKVYTSIKLAEITAKRLPVPKVRLMQIDAGNKATILPEIEPYGHSPCYKKYTPSKGEIPDNE